MEWVKLVDDKGARSAQPADKGISRAAKELGVNRREVQRSSDIASLSPEAKAVEREVGLDNNQIRAACGERRGRTVGVIT